MCYYNSVKIPLDEFIRLKDFELAIAGREMADMPLVNGFDYGRHPVLKKKADEEDIELTSMEWGFLPPYIFTREKADQFRMGYKKKGAWQQPFITLNAKGEELLQPNKIFREAALQRRCLVLSSGFYEWRHVFPLSKKTGKPVKTALKFPYFISMKGREYFFMAGIWQPWKDLDTGEYVETFAIVTTVANPLMAQIHNSRKRMPVILPEDLACEWLMGNPGEDHLRKLATYQAEPAGMNVITIARDFRDSANPQAEFSYENLEPVTMDIYVK